MDEAQAQYLTDQLVRLQQAMDRLPQYQSGDDPSEVIEQAILMFDRINDDLTPLEPRKFQVGNYFEKNGHMWTRDKTGCWNGPGAMYVTDGVVKEFGFFVNYNDLSPAEREPPLRFWP